MESEPYRPGFEIVEAVEMPQFFNHPPTEGLFEQKQETLGFERKQEISDDLIL